MKMDMKAMDAPVGLRVTFEKAPVVKFHVVAKLPNPADPYRIDMTITLPEDRQDMWLDGVHAAFRRVQRGNGWTVRLDYENAIRFFNIDQLKKLDQKNPGFTIHVYRVPAEAMAEEKLDLKAGFSTKNFARSYYQQRKEAAANGTVCGRVNRSATADNAV